MATQIYVTNKKTQPEVKWQNRPYSSTEAYTTGLEFFLGKTGPQRLEMTEYACFYINLHICLCRFTVIQVMVD